MGIEDARGLGKGALGLVGFRDLARGFGFMAVAFVADGGCEADAVEPINEAVDVFLVRPAWRVHLRCKSPTGLIGGTVSRTARVSPARRNPKEAAGKH